jgi:hypothetical protein
MSLTNESIEEMTERSPANADEAYQVALKLAAGDGPG